MKRPGLASPAEASVLLVDEAFEWPQDLLGCIRGEGYVALHIDDLALAPSLLRNGEVKALLVGTRVLGAKGILILRECRQVSPRTAVVVMTTTPTQPDLKRAFESGATAFLSWPASPREVRQALGSGAQGSQAGGTLVEGRGDGPALSARPDHGKGKLGDARGLERVAELDGSLREKEGLRKGMVVRLGTARANLERLASRIQVERKELAALETRAGDDEAGVRRHRDSLSTLEARHAELLRDFEEELRRAEPLRAQLGGEIRDLQATRGTILEQLSPRVRSLYEGLVRDFSAPAIVSAAERLCSGCESPLPAPLLGEIGAGEVRTCPECGRILLPPCGLPNRGEAGKTG